MYGNSGFAPPGGSPYPDQGAPSSHYPPYGNPGTGGGGGRRHLDADFVSCASLGGFVTPEIDAALDRGRLARRSEPRAVAVSYDPRKRQLVVLLQNGCSISVPAGILEVVADATPAQIAYVEITGDGYGLHWPALDVDLSVPGLLAGLFGTRAHMARHAGGTKSEAKAKAARVNGAKGGRPRKSVAAAANLK